MTSDTAHHIILPFAVCFDKPCVLFCLNVYSQEYHWLCFSSEDREEEETAPLSM